MRTYIFDDDLSVFHAVLGFTAYVQPALWLMLAITLVFLVYELWEPENPINTVGDVVEFTVGAVVGLGTLLKIWGVIWVDYQLVAEILTFLLAVLSAHLGKKYRRARKVLGDVAKTLEDLDKALADNKLSPEEIKQIVSDLRKTVEDARA